MAEDSSRASSPEPGEAAPPRGRIIQLKSSSSASRGSMERQSLESARAGASPAYSQHSQQWRGGSPPRSRFPRPAYSSSAGGGRGYFKRQQQQQQQMNYDIADRGGAPPYPRERVFSRARGRSVSRSPSRASQRTRSRSRSHSPRSPKSPQRSRSRSRSRSFSPRGHRTFANWERSARNPPPGQQQQYVSGRGGRSGGGGSFDSRQRGRERDSWSSKGGRGGGRYANYQRGNRFYPKEVRYKTAAPVPRGRSISRDRGSSEAATQASAGFRDRQIRERDPRDREREYDQAYRGRPRERDVGNRSTSLVRTSSFSSDYYRDSEPSASAEEGEEKPEESHVTTSERFLGSRSPSDTGSTDRDMTSTTDSGMKRMSSLPARPPRPSADSYSSYRRDGSSPIASDGYRSPVDRRDRYSSETASRSYMTERYDAERSRSRIDSREVDRRDERSRTYEPPSVDDDDDVVKRKSRAGSMDRTMVDVGDRRGRSSPGGDSSSSVRSWGGKALPKQTKEATKPDECVDKTTSKASEAVSIAKDTPGTVAKATSAPLDASEEQGAAAVETETDEKRSAVVDTEALSSPKENQSPVNQGAPDPESKISVGNGTTVPAEFDSSRSEHNESESAVTTTRRDGERIDEDEADKKTVVSHNVDVDMDAASSVNQQASSQREVSGSDIEMKSVGNAEEQKGAKNELPSEVPSSEAPTSEAPVSEAAAIEVPASAESKKLQDRQHTEEPVATQPTVEPRIIPEAKEVEEGEMVGEAVIPSGEKDLVRGHTSPTGAPIFKTKEDRGSLEHTMEGNRAGATAKANAPPDPGMGPQKRARLERSRTDPSSAVYTDSNKLRSTSFSSFALSDSRRRAENVREEEKSSLHRGLETSAHGGRQDVHLKQRGDSSFLTQKNSPPPSGRPALDRRASFSALPDRSHYSSGHTSSDARLATSSMGYAGGSKTSRAASSFSSKASPPKPFFATSESNAKGRRRGPHDDLKKEDAVRRELMRAGSMDSMMDRGIQRSFPVAERVKESSTSTSNSPSRRSASDLRGSQLREELPTLPDIPLPSGAVRGTPSPTVLGEGTPTKRQRPRLGWGQGLVAPSPPQPTKRPRIGWGQGLVQQKDGSSRINDETSGGASQENASSVAHSSPVKTEEATVKSDAPEDEGHSRAAPNVSTGGDGVIEDASGKQSLVAEENAIVMSTPEKVKSPTPVPAKESSTPVKHETGKNDKMSVDGGSDTERDVEAPPELSKEEILSTIDVLDSDITGVKKQIKALQRTIANAEAKHEAPSKPVDVEVVSVGEPDTAVATAKLGSAAADPSLEVAPVSPTGAATTSADQARFSAPVKVAVDSKFVELLASVFSDNMRKTAAANEQIPKRMEQGQLATRIYHQPSDYAFYQANIDRGSAISDQVRLKVRRRNRARHEYMKKLARDYVELKKSWKLGVKKMEKDRKRQDKLRLKQLQKQKLKSMGESGPIRTTNTNHQSPHVQQLVAAEKAAEAAGNEGAVRTSSRLTNNSSGDLDNNDLEKIEQAKAQAIVDQEVRKKRLKNALSTVIPDMLITPAERQQRFFTRFVNGQSCMADGLVTDWKLKEKAEMKVNPWNDLEKCIYMDKFLQFPKNFPRISSFLRNKTTGDVIAFYYRTKKVADYKALLREQQLRRRGAGSKNTWSCWNLSACAAICLGVQFPEHVAKLLLHPSNFRSHQASDNILNSAGAQRLLRGSASKVDGNANTASNTEGSATGSSEVLSALDLVSGSDHTPCVRPPMIEEGIQLDGIVNSGDSDTSDEEKFNLYTQQLEQFIAGQQRPFLVDYASLLSDNSYSTGYEVSTLSIEERLKKYPTPSKELESAATTGVVGTSASIVSQEVASSKGKQQVQAAGSNGNSKNGGTHLTKKELKQQRKMKKMQEGAAMAVSSTTPTAASSSSQAVGNTGTEKAGNHSRKKAAAGSAAAPNSTSNNRSTPRISIPGEDKVTQGGKKTSRSGGATPASRRNSQQVNATSASPKTSAATSSTTATGTAPVSAPPSGSTKKGAGGTIAPHVKTSSPSANAGGSSNANAAAPAKRVVQKWTEGEKADFLKYFSQYGKDWATLTENIPTKTAAQIKNYYQNYKNRLNLQDILKRRIENAATSGAAKGAASAAASGSMAASPRSAAAGLMSGTLRQMGRSAELPGGISMGMPSGSMAMGVSDGNMSFQAALNAAQPGMHNAGELSMNQFGMQAHQDTPHQPQQQSRELMNPASNSERYLKLLNMQHQLQIMQFQQQQKSQGMNSDSAAGGSNNAPYHEGQMSAANAQRLYQFSRQQPPPQQQHQVPPQHLSLQALQQLGLSSQPQASSHSQMMQLSMQQHQQARGSYAEMGHPGNMYQSMAQMQTQQHPQQAMATAGQIGLSPTSAQQYGRPADTSTSVGADGMGPARGDAGGTPNQMGRHDSSQRGMMNMAMMNSAASGNAGTVSQSASSPHQPPAAPPRSMPMESSRQAEMESRQSSWQSSPAAGAPTPGGAKAQGSTANTVSSAPKQQDTAPKGREALAPPAPPPVQPVRSRMSFSSILNESESPRDDNTPRGNGSMVIRQQESPRVSEQQQRQQPQLRIEHARAIPPSSAAEMARSPVSAPSPTAHLLPRRSSAPAHNRMGLMSSLLNVPSPERRTSTPGHQSPVMHQQQQMQRQMQAARYYDPSASSAASSETTSRGSIATMGSGVPVSSTMSSTMVRGSPNEKMSAPASMAGYTSTSAQMAVALTRSGSGSSTSSAVSANAVKADPRAQQLQQQQQQQQPQMWNYAPQMRLEEAELLLRAQRAEEEAARAAAAAAAAARALQEAQQARQQALDMARQAHQYQQLQQYQIQQIQHQHEYQHQHQHQAQQLHHQQLQQQALHHHLQLMQQQQQQPPRGPER